MIKINDDKIEKILSEVVEKTVNENGCTNCHGKNIDVYINEIERRDIYGYFYCYDCEEKGIPHVEHSIFDTLDNIEHEFINIFRSL